MVHSGFARTELPLLLRPCGWDASCLEISFEPHISCFTGSVPRPAGCLVCGRTALLANNHPGGCRSDTHQLHLDRSDARTRPYRGIAGTRWLAALCPILDRRGFLGIIRKAFAVGPRPPFWRT